MTAAVGSRNCAGRGAPQYRLRVGEVRAFYIPGSIVQLLAIVVKSEAEAWLVRFAEWE